MKHVLAVFLLAIATPLLAQTPPAASGEIVVTASAVPETVESTPAAVTVLTRTDIEQRGATDLADVLREVPGLTLSRTGSAGRATSLFTRGSNSTHTLVLWNGIELNNPYFSGFDWGQFATTGVEQVEVVRGPYSALYGSEAVAGVVNVLTTPRTSNVNVLVEGGGHGYRNANVSGAYVTSSMMVAGAYGHREDDGFAPNDDLRQNNGNVFWRWTPVSTFSLGVSARRNSYDLGIPTNTNLAGDQLVPSLHRRGDGNDREIALPVSQTIGRFAYDLTLADVRRSDNFHDPDDPYGLVDSYTDSRVRRARLATRTTTSSFGTFVLGGEYERAIVDDRNTYGTNLDNDRRRERAFFVEDRLSHELASGSHLELSVGARYDHFDTFGSQTSPRAAVAFVTGNTKVRAAYGEAFRAPSVGELYFPFSGNRNLDAERSRNFEIGFDHGLANNGLFTATYFNSRFRNLIVFDPATFIFANIGRAKSDGLELGYERRVVRQFYTAISYTYLHSDDDESTGKRLLRRPKHSGSASLGYTRGAVDTNLTVIRSGAREDILPIAPYSRISNKGYTTLDANVQWHFGRLVPFVRLENATNQHYEEVKGYPSPGRRAIVGIRFGS